MSPLFYLGLIPTLSLLFIHALWISDRRNTPGGNVAAHVVGVLIVALVFGGAGAWQVFSKRAAKAITSFSFLGADNSGLGVDVTAKIDDQDITASLPPSANVKAMVAAFETSGASVAVGGVEQTSGTSRNDFSSPVEYTVTAADGSTQTYKVIASNMVTIEASLAMKKTKVTQPQKPHEEPPPPVKPVGVSHDETKKPDPKPPEKKDDPKPQKPPTDIKDLEQKYKHSTDDDAPGKPVTQIGDFNGSEHGFATDTKGDPYIQALVADMQVDVPNNAKDDGTPVGCIHITPEGKIPDTQIMQRTSGDYTNWAEQELKKLQTTRNDKPVAVPDKLLPLTTKWLCFKFTVAQ